MGGSMIDPSWQSANRRVHAQTVSSIVLDI